MSQVRFETEHRGNQIEVIAGWDPPLGHFFLTVFNLDPEADTEIIWSTLGHPSQEDSESTARLEKQLFLMGIDVPDSFWPTVRLREDGATIRTVA